METQNRSTLSCIWIAACIMVFSSTVISAQSLTDALSSNENVSSFASIVQQAELESQLNSGAQYTIFAPSNTAIGAVSERLERTGSTGLRRFVLNHIITGMASKRQIGVMSHTPSLGGLELNFEVDNEDNVWINDLLIVEYNIRAQNGIIHVLDGTLE